VIRASTAARVAIWPNETYTELIHENRSASWWRALVVPLVTAVTIGASTTITATGVASLVSIGIGALSWSFVPVIQLANGLLLCRRPPRGPTDRARAIELFFQAHLPWSLWMIGVALVLLWRPQESMAIESLLQTTAVPIAWTGVIVRSFCVTVLGCSPGQASWRALVYLGITLAVMFMYLFLAVGLWPRIVGALS
jgi:hypothetical protein